MRTKEALWFYFFISPWLLGAILLTFGPMGASIWLSLTNWDMFQPAQFVGLDNYGTLLIEDKIFGKALFNTFYYSFISVPLAMLVSIGMAALLHQKLKGMNVYRTIFYLPSIVPVVATSMLFIWFFAPSTGLINSFLSLLGIEGPRWLLDQAWVKPALILMSLWGVGGSVVLLLAGMKGIPQELYEAADIDGASGFQSFTRVTVPMLSPIIFFNLVMGIIAAFQTFAQVFIVTAGGPNNASMMMVPYLFTNAFRFFKMGYASAMAWILFIIILVLTLIVFKSSALWVHYEERRGSE